MVEKILAPHESLRDDWPVEGTTGYDFVNLVARPAGRSGRRGGVHGNLCAFTGADEELRGDRDRDSKIRIMDNEMASELERARPRRGAAWRGRAR